MQAQNFLNAIKQRDLAGVIKGSVTAEVTSTPGQDAAPSADGQRLAQLEKKMDELLRKLGQQITDPVQKVKSLKSKTPKNGQCWYYGSGNECPYGNECKFLHAGPRMEAPTTVAKKSKKGKKKKQQQKIEKTAAPALVESSGSDTEINTEISDDPMADARPMRTRSHRQRTWAEVVSGGDWPDDSSSEESETLPPKKGICWNWQRTGGCRFGDACRHQH